MSKKLLIVDDEKGIATVGDKIASGLGFDVRAVTDPVIAMDTYRTFDPDIMLLDMMMPEVDGIEILNQILAEGTHARIIVMTGHGSGLFKLTEAMAEFHGHADIANLAKPFRRNELIELLAPQPQVVALA